jgi:hypothetical protein
MSEDKKCLDHESLFGYMNKHNVLCIVDKCFPEQPPKATVTPCKFSLSRGIPRYISVFLRDKADTKFIEMTSLCVRYSSENQLCDTDTKELIKMTNRNMRKWYDKKYKQNHAFMFCIEVGRDIKYDYPHIPMREFYCTISPSNSNLQLSEEEYRYHAFFIY